MEKKVKQPPISSLNLLLESESFLEFSKEVVLQSLKTINDKLTKLELVGDMVEIEFLNKEFVQKYEKLYTILDCSQTKELFTIKNDDNLSNELKVKKENFMNIIENIMKKNGHTQDSILIALEKRKKNGNEAASIVVKNLYEYELKEINKKYTKILSLSNSLLNKLDKLNAELSNSIQQIDQEKIIEQIFLLQQKHKVIENEIFKVKNIKQKIEDTLNLKWRYEIYGTLHKNNLRESIQK